MFAGTVRFSLFDRCWQNQWSGGGGGELRSRGVE